MPKMRNDRKHHPTRGLKGVSGRKVAPKSPLTLWFVIRRLTAALIHGLINGAVITGVTYIFIERWEWMIFVFTIPFSVIGWLVFAKRPDNPEGGSGSQILDVMIRMMLADLPIIADNITSPFLVGLMVWASVPYIIWQYGLLGLISPGGACVDIHVYTCSSARSEATFLLIICLGAMTVPAALMGILHRKVLRETIFHLPGFASKDDQGASGPLTTLVESLGGLLDYFGISHWLNRFNPSVFKMALVIYLAILWIFMLALAAAVLWVVIVVQPQIATAFYSWK